MKVGFVAKIKSPQTLPGHAILPFCFAVKKLEFYSTYLFFVRDFIGVGSNPVEGNNDEMFCELFPKGNFLINQDVKKVFQIEIFCA